MEIIMQIPRVSLDIMSSTTTSIEHNDKFWQDVADKIQIENSLLYQLITVTSHGEQDENYKAGYERGALLMYFLLSSQLEADEMNKKWG